MLDMLLQVSKMHTMPKYLLIFSRHDYQNETGEVQTRWYKVGYLKITENGGKFLRLFTQPNIDYYCFENEADVLPEIPA